MTRVLKIEKKKKTIGKMAIFCNFKGFCQIYCFGELMSFIDDYNPPTFFIQSENKLLHMICINIDWIQQKS